MKKFIYVLNILLLVLIPTTVLVSGQDNTIRYEADTTTNVKMIKTTVLLDRSIKKKEQEEEEQRKKDEEEQRKKEEEEKAKAAKIKEVAVTVPIKVVEEVSSLASSDGASDATEEQEPPTSNPNVGSSTTVTITPSEQVYLGAKLTGSMSAYGTDCCSSNPDLQGHTASGFNIKLNGMYYVDAEYNRVRILAGDKNFKLYSIVKVNDPIDGEYTAIVLDRGDSNIGLGRRFMFDLVVESQEWARLNYGVHKNVNYEILRIGK